LDIIIQGIVQAFQLLIHGDAEVLRVTALSLAVSVSATVLSLFIGVSLGTVIGLTKFVGRRFIISLINTGMGAPPVVVGLVVMILLWRNGPLGIFHLLFTPQAMVIAQFLISLPLVTGFTMASIQNIDPKLRLQLVALGASRWQLLWLLVKDARLPLLAAVMAGFGAVISEVGASLMVGGNIKDETRVLTTAIAQEAGRGEFGLAIALSIILIILVYIVNLTLTIIQQRSKTR